MNFTMITSLEKAGLVWCIRYMKYNEYSEVCCLKTNYMAYFVYLIFVDINHLVLKLDWYCILLIIVILVLIGICCVAFAGNIIGQHTCCCETTDQIKISAFRFFE